MDEQRENSSDKQISDQWLDDSLTPSRGVRISIRYGIAGGLLAAVILLVVLSRPATSFEAKAWNFLIACGFAATLGLTANIALARARGSTRLPATFFHAYHVYLGRIAASFAVAHAALLIALEPTILSDLRLAGSVSTWAGGGSLIAMILLGTIPWRNCRAIHERRPNFVNHAVLSILAVGLALIHIFAKDYRDSDVRSWIWLLLLGAAISIVAFRYLSKSRSVAAPMPQHDARHTRALARNALSVSTLIVIFVLSIYIILR